MNKKDEQKADARLKQLGVTPRIYHYVDIGPFAAITIAEDVLTWTGAKREIERIMQYHILEGMEGPATKLKEMLRAKKIYGVAVCYKRDRFNARRGRTIAKGKLAKALEQERLGMTGHLKEKEKREKALLLGEIKTALGRASMCWEYPERAGVFDTERAIEIAQELYDLILRGVKDEKN